MSNYPHSASIAASLSTSPFGPYLPAMHSPKLTLSAVHSNLETLINRSRSHPHPRRPSDTFDQPSGSTAHLYSARRQSEYDYSPRVGTIQEASYDDAILLGDDDDMADERTRLLRQAEERSRRKSYGAGAISQPVGERVGRRYSANVAQGNSRSRSTVRTPPREEPVKEDHGELGPSSYSNDEERDNPTSPKTARGRTTDSRSLPRASFQAGAKPVDHRRRQSVAARFADDSSGDEGGDVARGMVANGGGAMFGVRAGLGITPAPGGGAGCIEYDPVEELCAQDLELPVAQDGLEVRVWTEALRVS
jgi:MATE family multidrug resistance protein